MRVFRKTTFTATLSRTRLYMGLCIAHWMRADLKSLILTATQMDQLARQRNLAEAAGWAHYFLGCAYYQLNDLVRAEEAFAFVVGHRYVTHSLPFSQSGFGLASVLQAKGARDRAREVADSMAAYALEMAHQRIRVDAEAFAAWLALQRGSVSEAQQWAASYNPNTPPVPMTTFHVTLAARARILVATATPTSYRETAAALAQLHRLAEISNSTRFLIEALALEALLHDSRGDRDAALNGVKQAVSLAEPGGIIRAFVDLGPKMGSLLRRLAAHGVAPEYLLRLLASFPHEQGSRSVPRQDQANEWKLIEPLSERELDVLDLLVERLSDKEIARELNISAQTVKRHASNIYQKLGVGSRREAVEKAAALGLILSPQLTHPRSRSRV